MHSATHRNGHHPKTILGQVREILKYHPDATLEDVEGLVEVPRGKSHSSIQPSYSTVTRELGLKTPRRKRRSGSTFTKCAINTAHRLLEQTGSLASAVDLLRTVAHVAAVTEHP